MNEQKAKLFNNNTDGNPRNAEVLDLFLVFLRKIRLCVNWSKSGSLFYKNKKSKIMLILLMLKFLYYFILTLCIKYSTHRIFKCQLYLNLNLNLENKKFGKPAKEFSTSEKCTL